MSSGDAAEAATVEGAQLSADAKCDKIEDTLHNKAIYSRKIANIFHLCILNQNRLKLV